MSAKKSSGKSGTRLAVRESDERISIRGAYARDRVRFSRTNDYRPLLYRAGAAALVAGLIYFLFFTGGQPLKLQAVHPVSGQVLFEGRPLANAAVTLVPVNDAEGAHRPSARTDSQGWFKVSTHRPGDGAPEGQYRVVVEYRQMVVKRSGEYEAGPNLLASRYSDPNATSLLVQVAQGENTLKPIQIQR